MSSRNLLLLNELASLEAVNIREPARAFDLAKAIAGSRTISPVKARSSLNGPNFRDDTISVEGKANFWDDTINVEGKANFRDDTINVEGKANFRDDTMMAHSTVTQ